MAQATGANFISSAAEGATYGAINRSPFYSLAAEGATHDASNGQPFHARRARAQPMAQAIGASYILGGRWRNLWRNQ